MFKLLSTDVAFSAAELQNAENTAEGRTSASGEPIHWARIDSSGTRWGGRRVAHGDGVVRRPPRPGRFQWTTEKHWIEEHGRNHG